MSSVIHYRFKAGRGEWSRIEFEGHTLSVHEIKRMIADQKKLTQQTVNTGSSSSNSSIDGVGTSIGPGGHTSTVGRMLQDFELILTNADTGEEYSNDGNVAISKNTSLIVKRVPAMRQKTVRITADTPVTPLDSNSSNTSLISHGHPRLSSSVVFDETSAAKRFRSTSGSIIPIQAEDAISELHRRGMLQGGSGSTDEFGDDPLDESSYIQKEEEKRVQEAKDAREKQTQLLKEREEEVSKQSPAPSSVTPSIQTTHSFPTHMTSNGMATTNTSFVRPPPARPPPPYYICHYCHQKGHWKQCCPSISQQHTNSHMTQPESTQSKHQQSVSFMHSAFLHAHQALAADDGCIVICNVCSTDLHGRFFYSYALYVYWSMCGTDPRIAALLYATRPHLQNLTSVHSSTTTPSTASSMLAAMGIPTSTSQIAMNVAGTTAIPSATHTVTSTTHATETSSSSSTATAAAIASTSPDLICSLCTRLFAHPVVVPCCFTSFCDECIRQVLMIESSKCPRCHTAGITSESLRPNNVLQRRVEQEQKRLATALTHT